MGQPIDGKTLAAGIRTRLATEIRASGITPRLAVILVGHDPASHLYVGLKEKACAEVGIAFERHLRFATTPAAEIESLVRALGTRNDLDGIVVQLPLPPHMDEDNIVAMIPPERDVDGFHPTNLERLERGNPLVVPALAKSIAALIAAAGELPTGNHAAILANSHTFCRPIEWILRTQFGLHVTRYAQFQPGTHRAPDIASAAVLVSALGCGGCIDARYVRTGATLIDVGVARGEDGIIRGDFSTDAQQTAGWFTPVPGGVGPMTVAMLLENVVEVARRRRP